MTRLSSALRTRNACTLAPVPSRTRPQPWTAAQLGAIPVGFQPEDDGHLVCLLCGRLYRKMAMHLARRHDMTCDGYRDQFELPRTFGLQAADLRDQQTAYARAQYPTNTGLQTALSYPQRVGYVRQAVAARTASASRAGTRRAQRDYLQRRSASVRAATRAGYDERARDLGYADIADLLARTDEHTDESLGRLLGVSESTAGRIRRLYGHPVLSGDQRRGQQYTRHHRHRWTAAAQAAGYTDLHDCLARTRHLPANKLAALLQASLPTIAKLRQEASP